MAQNSKKIEPADITFWGMSALIAGGIAVLSTSVSVFIPDGFFGGLHSSRMEGGTLNQLQAQVEQLKSEQRKLLQQTNEMRSRFSLSERDRSAVNLRVGALETTIPMLLEVVPTGLDIDRLSITASIGDENVEQFNAEGGSVTVIRTPMFGAKVPLGDDMQPVPPPLTSPDDVASSDQTDAQNQAATATMPSETVSDTSDMLDEQAASDLPLLSQKLGLASISQTMFGIALGNSVAIEGADALWEDIQSKIGALLIGLDPAISDPLGNENFRLVLGPISNYSEAEMLCRRIVRVGIDCLPVQYGEENLPAISKESANLQ